MILKRVALNEEHRHVIEIVMSALVTLKSGQVVQMGSLVYFLQRFDHLSSGTIEPGALMTHALRN